MKKKILIIQDTLSGYNEPLYRVLNNEFELTLAYSNKIELNDNEKFKIIKLERFKFLNIFYIKNKFFQFCNQFDVVIFSADLHYFSFCFLPFLRKKKFKAIAWTIGIRASYSLRYDLNRKKNIIDLIYFFILKKCDALVFYMKEPIEFWGKKLPPNKIFVAQNTIEVDCSLIKSDIIKNTFLFVGTLYKEKKIYELIDAFTKAYQKSGLNKSITLEIIGDGPEYKNIKSYITENNLTDLINLRGRIIDEYELSKSFNKSILCISPDQAGLSVLMSMGYGVPFVTRTNAITGGERLNIINNYNGFYYNSIEELTEILFLAYQKLDNYLAIGNNAKNYYQKNATINIMANGFIKAIEYVTSQNLKNAQYN
jgi:glycosyltransferase involved in cell wall biosynthesis